mmetsp:Transcript_67745/g.152293  ORF Transcript_67745/g.152293 Transcript_67745/m.152293 type:complete len:309 (+) Transcript_67745:66-992(+)
MPTAIRLRSSAGSTCDRTSSAAGFRRPKSSRPAEAREPSPAAAPEAPPMGAGAQGSTGARPGGPLWPEDSSDPGRDAGNEPSTSNPGGDSGPAILAAGALLRASALSAGAVDGTCDVVGPLSMDSSSCPGDACNCCRWSPSGPFSAASSKSRATAATGAGDDVSGDAGGLCRSVSGVIGTSDSSSSSSTFSSSSSQPSSSSSSWSRLPLNSSLAARSKSCAALLGERGRTRGRASAGASARSTRSTAASAFTAASAEVTASGSATTACTAAVQSQVRGCWSCQRATLTEMPAAAWPIFRTALLSTGMS